MARRILGIDPGLTRCGVGVIDVEQQNISLVDVSVLLTSKDEPLENRLLQLEQQFTSLIERVTPDVIAIERVFSQHNVRTVMGTGQAAGVALLLAAKSGIPVFMHTPSEVKAAVTGNGRADQTQVAAMDNQIPKLHVQMR